jgi:hypothetical protein
VALDGYLALFRVLLNNSDNFMKYVRNVDALPDVNRISPFEKCIQVPPRTLQYCPKSTSSSGESEFSSSRGEGGPRGGRVDSLGDA